MLKARFQRRCVPSGGSGGDGLLPRPSLERLPHSSAHGPRFTAMARSVIVPLCPFCSSHASRVPQPEGRSRQGSCDARGALVSRSPRYRTDAPFPCKVTHSSADHTADTRGGHFSVYHSCLFSHLASYTALPAAGLYPHSCSYFRMAAFGDWGVSGRTLHNQQTLICQDCNIFFLELFQECVTGGGGDEPWNREHGAPATRE